MYFSRPKRRTIPIPAPFAKINTAGLDMLNRLRSFLDINEPDVIMWLHRTWDNQQKAITYKELRTAMETRIFNDGWLQQWHKEYSDFVTHAIAPKMLEAMELAAERLRQQYPHFLYNPSVAAAQEFVTMHGAQFVTNVIHEQREALSALINRASSLEALTPDQLALQIRPLVGLTRPQALANFNYYASVLDRLHIDGAMSRAAAEKRALQAARVYAARQHRYRAMNIARTELAFAYNHGAYNATKDAQRQGYLGKCVKRWLTAEDERTCEICRNLDEKAIGMDDPFDFPIKRPPYPDFHMSPPAHPSCRCSVIFEEVEEPVLTGAGNITADPIDNSPEEVYNVSELEKYYAKKDVDAIVDILKRANKDAVALWNKYADKIRFDSITIDDAKYSPVTKGVTIDLNKEPNNPRGAYGTTFHELGHLFDNAAGGGYSYASVRNSDFTDKLYSDYNDSVKAKKVQLEKKLGRKAKISEVRACMNHELQQLHGTVSGVSDILSGVSKGKVMGNFAHSIKYWKQDSDRVAKEAFAQMYQAAILGGDKMRYMHDYFPSSFEEFFKILKSVVN